MLLRQSVSSVAQQLLCACITADIRMHNSCCACDGQLLCANYYPDLCPLCLFVTGKNKCKIPSKKKLHPFFANRMQLTN